MPTFKTKATSAARTRLKECLAARAEVEAKVAELTAATAKLDSQISAVEPALAAVSALDEAEDFRALKWARGEAERPEPNVEARDRLRRYLGGDNALRPRG